MDFLQLATVAIGGGLAIGGVISGVYVAINRGVLELLKTENAAYKESNARLHEDNKTITAERDSARAEVAVWKDTVTQRPSIEKMIETNQANHIEYMKELGKVATALTNLAKAQGDLPKQIADAILKAGMNGNGK